MEQDACVRALSGPIAPCFPEKLAPLAYGVKSQTLERMTDSGNKPTSPANLAAQLIELDRSLDVGLRDQVQSEIARLITTGALRSGTRLPSCRKLAGELNISVNTVLGAYSRLCDDNLIEARARSGYFICDDLRIPLKRVADPAQTEAPPQANFVARITPHRLPSKFSYILRPPNCQDYEYPFVCNQIDIQRFPITEWRECTRMAMNRRDLGIWSGDNQYWDSQELLDQICHRLLPRRGITADSENVLVTVGAQQALYLIASLLRGPGRVVAMEDPGYPDARNIFEQLFDEVRFIPVDEEGLIVDERLEGCDLVYLTPNRQFPTTVSLSPTRRASLLEVAEKQDLLIIEDDYESDVDFRVNPPLPLYQSNRTGRVVYISSLSKSLAPGLRLGFLVAPPDLVTELRALRGMMIRHPPLVLQHAAALFLRFGHYDALCSRLHGAYERRWTIANRILQSDFSDFGIQGEVGGTNFMLTDPAKRWPASDIVRNALNAGLVIESVAPCFFDTNTDNFSFRVGFSAVQTVRIEPGLRILRKVIDAL